MAGVEWVVPKTAVMIGDGWDCSVLLDWDEKNRATFADDQRTPVSVVVAVVEVTINRHFPRHPGIENSMVDVFVDVAVVVAVAVVVRMSVYLFSLSRFCCSASLLKVKSRNQNINFKPPVRSPEAAVQPNVSCSNNL